MHHVSLLGIPHDDNSSYMKGAALAQPKIREAMWSDAYSQWTETGIDLGAPGCMVDHGDLAFDAATDAWDIIEHGVARALEAGHPLISLGGDHAISHPILRAVRRRHPRLTILHIDAHADIYDAYQDNPRSHASPFARIMEDQLTDRLIQIGIRTSNDHHRAQFKRFGVEVFEMSRWSSFRFDITTPIYVSLDLDGLDPSCAPGVSHREPGGPTTRQVLDLLHRIDQPIVGADIVEYNPRCDIADLTATVAAKLTKELAGLMIKNAR
jgi:agmatinase